MSLSMAWCDGAAILLKIVLFRYRIVWGCLERVPFGTETERERERKRVKEIILGETVTLLHVLLISLFYQHRAVEVSHTHAHAHAHTNMQ